MSELRKEARDNPSTVLGAPGLQFQAGERRGEQTQFLHKPQLSPDPSASMDVLSGTLDKLLWRKARKDVVCVFC